MEYIKMALEEAKKAYLENEVPVGAVIVQNGKILSRAHNTKLKNNSIFNHAEILAIKKACQKIGDWRLNDCEMYVTLEPCPMCAGAIKEARINKIYIGAYSNLLTNREVIKKILCNNDYYHFVDINYLNDYDCSKILTDFFSSKR